MDMIIRNVGLGPAYSIKFEINPDFEYSKGRFLSELGFMKNGLEYLAPNQTLQFFLTSMVEDFEKRTKTLWEIKVTYQNSLGRKYEGKYLIDFVQFVGLSQLGEPPLYKIGKKIEDIQRDLHHLSTGFSKIKVITSTEKEEAEKWKQLGERSTQLQKEDKG